jgi:hypothetical protein
LLGGRKTPLHMWAQKFVECEYREGNVPN